MGRSTSSELRPFSINGLSEKISWTWWEFFLMGCQWSNLYYPLFWFAMYLLFTILLVPKALLILSKKQYTYKHFVANGGYVNCTAWVLQELCKIHVVWYGLLGYLFYLVLCPWFSGQVFTDSGDWVFMTYVGWMVKTFNSGERHEYIGFPDVMVIVLPHLVFVATMATAALAAEKENYREHVLSLSGKKQDDHDPCQVSRKSKFRFVERWVRKIILVVCLAVIWKHFMNCRAHIKA